MNKAWILSRIGICLAVFPLAIFLTAIGDQIARYFSHWMWTGLILSTSNLVFLATLSGMVCMLIGFWLWSSYVDMAAYEEKQ